MISDKLPGPILDQVLDRLVENAHEHDRGAPAKAPDETDAIRMWPDDPRGILGLAGCAAIAAENFSEFAGWLAEHVQLVSADLALSVEVERTELCLRVVSSHAGARWREVAYAALMMRLVRCFAGTRAQALRASFSGPEPDDVEAYVRMLGVKPRFGTLGCELVLASEHAFHTNSQADRMLFEQIAGYARLALLRLRDETPVSQHVVALLGRDPTHVTMGMDEAALHLGMSARTLRRRLGDEGASFADLKRQGLVHQTRALLSNPSVSIKEAAYRLGYGDPSALHRAVRRAVGIPPSALREWGRRH